MNFKRVLIALLTVLVLFSGCSNKKENTNEIKLDPNNPVSLTIWHYYNGAQQAAFDELLQEFNATIGKQKGIYVEGYSQGSVTDLEKALSDSVAEKVGAKAMPDIFSTYADTAYAIQKQGKLADLKSYFTDEELDLYVDGYIEEGYFFDDNALYLFPVAKSTEVMMLNTTDWEPFAKECNVSYDDLATIEGVVEVSKKYYEWSNGKAFYGRDSMSNYFIIGMKQMGVDIFDVKDGNVTIRAEKDKIRRLWDNYYVPFVSGYFTALGKFRSDDVKTGDILCYTGSTSSSMYFPDEVVLDDGNKKIEYVVLPAPIMKAGERYAVQQGAGMAVTKSDVKREYAATEFLKWFTAKENNLRFVCESSYLPVRKDANSIDSLDLVIKNQNLNVNEKVYDCLVSVLSQSDSVKYYTTKSFNNGYQTRKVLDFNLFDKAVADKKAIESLISSGVSRDEALRKYIGDESFESWYKSFCDKLETTAHK